MISFFLTHFFPSLKSSLQILKVKEIAGQREDFLFEFLVPISKNDFKFQTMVMPLTPVKASRSPNKRLKFLKGTGRGCQEQEGEMRRQWVEEIRAHCRCA